MHTWDLEYAGTDSSVTASTCTGDKVEPVRWLDDQARRILHDDPNALIEIFYRAPGADSREFVRDIRRSAAGRD